MFRQRRREILVHWRSADCRSGCAAATRYLHVLALTARAGAISVKPSPAMARKRLPQAMDSSLDLTSNSAKPAMSSLDSAYGPSVTVTWPLALFSTVHGEVGSQPPVFSSTPACVISSERVHLGH
jgi:hypothetical protein